MKTRLVRIGNSRGVRIPKPLIEQAGLDVEVEIRVTGEGLTISSASSPRAGWSSAAAQLHARGEDGLLDPPAPTSEMFAD